MSSLTVYLLFIRTSRIGMSNWKRRSKALTICRWHDPLHSLKFKERQGPPRRDGKSSGFPRAENRRRMGWPHKMRRRIQLKCLLILNKLLVAKCGPIWARGSSGSHRPGGFTPTSKSFSVDRTRCPRPRRGNEQAGGYSHRSRLWGGVGYHSWEACSLLPSGSEGVCS